MAKAALAQFEGFDAMEHMHAMIRSPKQMELALAAIQRTPGLVLYTLVDRELRAQLETMRRQLPDAACVLVTPADRGQKVIGTTFAEKLQDTR